MAAIPIVQRACQTGGVTDDFAHLVAAKRGARIAVCIPALNEAATIGRVAAEVRTLVEGGLVDELIVMDDGSTDATALHAQASGARVVSVTSVLPQVGPGAGKGEVLWKSLAVTTGDIVCWVDADIENISSTFITGLLAPLLTNPDIHFVKGHYRRPVGEDPTGGGRVTELAARPLISRFFPELARFPQPLSGEFAGRRHVLEAIPFVQGWGVDLGLLIDISALVGVHRMATADLGTRIHRNRSLRQLGPQAMAVQGVVLRRAGKLPSGSGAPERDVLLRPAADGLSIEQVNVEVRERPPMATILRR